jgi:hypothetical protein
MPSTEECRRLQSSGLKSDREKPNMKNRMTFFTFGCDCGCPDPLLMSDESGFEAIRIFRAKEAAQVEASEYEPALRIIECEVQQI